MRQASLRHVSSQRDAHSCLGAHAPLEPCFAGLASPDLHFHGEKNISHRLFPGSSALCRHHQ
eukprot:3843592-Pyramimonas_sp.AAC.1